MFDSNFGLTAPPSFKVIGETGGAPPVYGSPGTNPVNPRETAGDVEWAHAIAPKASLVLVELQNGIFDDDIATAITKAVPSVHASVVSMSFDKPEFGGEIGTATNAYDDGIFTGAGVTYVASSGDNGQPPEYPAVSPNVIAVGATDLYLNTDGSWQSETGWGNPVITDATESVNTVTITISAATASSFTRGDNITVSGVGLSGYDGSFQIASVNLDPNGYTASLTYSDPCATGLLPSSGGTVTGDNNGGSGGGISAKEPEPSYQSNAYAANCGYYTLLNPESTNSKRANPDVSFIGGEPTPVFIFSSGSLTTFAGTSLSAPCWAGLIAIADQGLSNGGAPLLTSVTSPAELYQLPTTDFHDVTSGFNGFYAGTGYDYVSGIGTPIANLLIPDLVNLAGVSAVGHATLPLPILQNVATGSVLLATFTQGAFTQGATAYSATVAWGDGSVDTTSEPNSPLSVVVTGQTIQIFGSHAFSTSGALTVGIAINGPGGASGTAYATADVASDVSSDVSVSRSGLTYNRSTKLFYGALTLTNRSTTSLSGSLDILLQGLTHGVTLAVASVTINGKTYSLSIALDSAGDPYIHIPQSLLNSSPLGPGKSLTISLEFSDPGLALIAYNVDAFSDPFDS